MSAAAAAGPAEGRSARARGSISTGLLSADERNRQRDGASVTSDLANCSRPVASFVPSTAGSRACMLGLRSRITIAVSGRPPPASASQPRDSGRPTAMITAATTSIRRSMISQCRSFE